MRFPISLYSSMSSLFIRNALAGKKKFPLVLMLEPTHRCNLACAGCDRIRLYGKEHTEDLSLKQCIDAAVESGAPELSRRGAAVRILARVAQQRRRDLWRVRYGQRRRLQLRAYPLAQPVLLGRSHPAAAGSALPEAAALMHIGPPRAGARSPSSAAKCGGSAARTMPSTAGFFGEGTASAVPFESRNSSGFSR